MSEKRRAWYEATTGRLDEDAAALIAKHDGLVAIAIVLCADPKAGGMSVSRRPGASVDVPAILRFVADAIEAGAM